MNNATIVKLLDEDIDRLEQAKALLQNSAGMASGHRLNVIPGGKRKRVLSADARKRIADAQRRRWAKQKGLTKKAA